MELKEKYSNLLFFFDEKKFNMDETAKIIDMVVTQIKEKGGEHQAGCAWVIMSLYKRGKCNTTQINNIIDEFNKYCEGFDKYVESIVIGDINELPITYYNWFLDKKDYEQ